MIRQQTDIAIVGGGMIGSLALLATQGRRVTVLERQPQLGDELALRGML